MTLILIVILAVVGVLLARYLINHAKTSPRKFPSGRQISLGLVFAGFVLALAILSSRGSVHWVAPLVGFLAPVFVQLIPALLRRFRAGNIGADTRTQGRTSEVRSAWLCMTLDHDSGHMEGEILLGDHSGKFLSELSRAELLSLREAMNDTDSLRLLDTWLDRSHAGWRNARQHKTEEENTQGHAQVKMTREEALRVLGLTDKADETEIRSAHKQLMQKLHPDSGGSDYLAAVVNRAREVLLEG